MSMFLDRQFRHDAGGLMDEVCASFDPRPMLTAGATLLKCSEAPAVDTVSIPEDAKDGPSALCGPSPKAGEPARVAVSGVESRW
jgi:hypothetical protein